MLLFCQRMFKELLKFPILYKLSQKIFLADNFRKMILKKEIINKNSNVLDIGCGPGNMIKYLNFNRYYGFDTDEKYIEYAKKKFRKCKFFCEIFSKSSIKKISKIDTVILFGILHHINNDEVYELLKNIKLSLKNKYKIIVLDPVYVDDQNLIAKFLIKNDRGKFVRSSQKYIELFKKLNFYPTTKIYHQRIVPYTWIVSIIEK